MRTLWRKWAMQRFLWQGSKRLAQKDVLIFLDRPGYVYVLLMIITFIAGINYANNPILGFCFLISAILCVSFYITYKQLQGLEIDLSYAELGQVGEGLYLHINLQQSLPQTRYLYIQAGEQELRICMENLKQQLKVEFEPTQRGRFYYPDLKIRAVYPFGLVKAWSYIVLHRQLYSWIAPRPHFYANQHAATRPESSLDEFYELKHYQAGDALSHVAWKQLARGQGMYVKVFEPHQHSTHVEIDYARLPAATHEDKLSLMMGLVEQCEQQQHAYSLHLPRQRLARGQGLSQLQQAKRLLAEA